ncbi:M56 family metallopeptidase [Verrucomicrobiales bacterium]|nr:M56 family metallopeptidase [Verrucomicrobiales bacterium]
MITQIWDTFAHYALGSLLDGGIALCAAWIFWHCFRKALTPGVGWWLFALVLIKCIVPIPYSLPDIPETRVISPQPLPPVSEGLALVAFPSEPPVQPSEKPFPWKSVAVVIYGAVIVLGFTRIGRQFWKTRAIVGRSRKTQPPPGLPTHVEVRLSDEIRSPAAWNFGKPVILVPDALFSDLTQEELRWALAHEYAHLQRGDVETLFATRLIQILFFYHPVVWVAGRMMEILAEQECDRIATSTCSSSGADSANHLLAIAERTSGATDPILAPGLSAGGRTLKKRIKSLLRSASRNPLGTGGLVALVVAIAVIVPSFRAENKNRDLERRILELEQRLTQKSEREQRIETNISKARARSNEDRSRLGATKFRELEQTYQATKKIGDHGNAVSAMKELILTFPKSNRAGCSAIYIARLLQPGAERSDWLARCTENWGECYFLDGTSIGALARKLQAEDLLAIGDRTSAQNIYTAIAEQFPGATNFGGEPLLQ